MVTAALACVTSVLAVGFASQARSTVRSGPCSPSWRTVATPGVDGLLWGLAAISSGDVWVVGSRDVDAALIAHWNGRNWKRVPPAAIDGGLRAVAAAASDDVWAVGGRGTGSSVVPLIERWNGRRWRVVLTPRARGGLSAVTVISANDVWAVGDALTLHWDGRSWKRVPSPPGADYLTDVAAVAAHSVWAVGGTTTMHWNGEKWRIVPNPSPPYSADNNTRTDLGGVVAFANGDVWVAGSSQTGNTIAEGFVLRWRRARWDLQDLGASAITDLSATTPTAIWAVGYMDPQNGGPYAARWNGKRWQESPIPRISGDPVVTAVGAVSPREVWAVTDASSYLLHYACTGR